MAATHPTREFVTGIVLAAGTSSRLGRPKQLLPLAGKPVLRHVIDTLESTEVDEIVVVLGHQVQEVLRAVPTTGRTRVSINDEYASGQSTSLRAGLRAASDRSHAALILLGDQPGVRAAAVAMVIEAWRGGTAPAVQAGYRGVPGHPVLFDRSLWPQLERVKGDEGARGILAAHREWRRVVEVGGPPPLDIDTEEDFATLRADFEGV
jgi:molybdenum cofactor cytidylyltransferase